MRRGLVGMLAAATALLAAPWARAGAQRTPTDPALDVVHYGFALTLPDSGARFQGTAALTVARRAHADTLALDLVGLAVDTVRVNGARVTPRRTADRLYVPLPAGEGDTLRVAVSYGGVPDDGLIIRRDSAGRWTYFGDNWPNRARHWLPTVDHPSDKATVSWSVSAPATATVVGNGTMTGQVAAMPLLPGGAPRRVTTWNEVEPIPTDLMVIAAAPLVKTPLGDTACGLAHLARCVPQMVYTAPEQADFMPGPFAAADRIVTFFARLIAPFPFEKLAHLQSSTRFGGMENATEIFYADELFRDHTMNDGVISHETAHQWFGDAVTETDWPDLWLSEGFATYFSALWTQHARGDSAFRVELRKIRTTVLGDDRVATLPVIDTVETNLMALLDRNSYEKGGFILHMLRRSLGDSAFFRGLRIYYHAHEYGNATSADLRRALEQSSGESLVWFFDQWLRRPGFPVLTVHWTYDELAHVARVTVDQSDRFGYYRAPLTVELRDAAGHAQRATIPLDASATTTTSIRVAMPGAPTALVADPDVDLLAKIEVLGEL